MNIEREQIRYAIASLEAQRSTLSDAVVDTTVLTLREKLSQLDSYTNGDKPRRTAQRKQVTILFANVTGFTGLAESIPDTNMLDIMNVLWRRLDGAITRHNGVIDKHIGDIVMGLFGVPYAREDDPERAVRAALAMRAALSDFMVEMEALRESGALPMQLAGNGRYPLRELQLRIGINTGPVLLGEVGTGDEYTVIGDAVNLASRLEHAVSPGGILISHDTYMLIRGIFNVESLGPITIRGRSEPIPVYMVLGAKSRLSYTTGRGVEGIETAMVGRDQEMKHLISITQKSIEQKKGHIITIVGEAGVGKSRLLHEYNIWLRTQSYQVQFFKGRTYERSRQIPFALIRDLFATHFNIQDDDPPAVAEDKLVKGMLALTDQPRAEVRSRARAVAQLIGLDLSARFSSVVVNADAPQVQELAFSYIAAFLKQVAAQSDLVLISLEDLHWADAGSLELIDYLSKLFSTSPLLILGLTRPSLFSARVHTGLLTATQKHQAFASLTDLIMELKALSKEDSRKLVVEILRKLPEIPADLSELIVNRADGNPFYVEELVKVLIEDGVIITGETQWQVQRNQLPEVRIPPHITGVLQARLDRLSALERATLQRAAVVGRVFWDTAVIYMNQLADEPISAADTIAALHALEKREMAFPRQKAVFAGAQTFIFKHAILQKVSYESVLLRERPFYHKQVADWLGEQSGERISEYASIIARHYELADERMSAAKLYEIAAIRAQDTFKPAVATDYYCKSLSLLSEKTHFAEAQLRLQDRLGALLCMQARFVEAAQTYMTMRYTAMDDGDLVAQATAWLGLAHVQREQGNYQGMLSSAIEGEQVAWLVNADAIVVQAQLYKGEAQLRLNETDSALVSAAKALEMSDRIENPEMRICCYDLLVAIYTELGREDMVAHYLQLLEQNVDHLENGDSFAELADIARPLAFNKTTLGSAYNTLGKYEKAAFHLLAALKMYRDIDYQQAIGKTLGILGETVYLRGNPDKAVPLFRQALTIAEATGDKYGTLRHRTHLGAALNALEKYTTAEKELRRVVTLSEDVAMVVHWRGLTEAYAQLAYAYLGQDKVNSALSAAQRALELASSQIQLRLQAVAWQAMGAVLSRLPSGRWPFAIGDSSYFPKDCFAESLRLLEKISGVYNFARRDQLITLWTWGQHHLDLGQIEQGETLLADAQQLANELDLQFPILK
ncbi:MAG: AAA family ATPase [Anaerolineales bacterium]|nr:AAA family ATPase [Anaerolineales bacterium]MCA9927978.1 AAA family ATPase [Anaerolineales bacterium]